MIIPQLQEYYKWGDYITLEELKLPSFDKNIVLVKVLNGQLAPTGRLPVATTT